MKNTFAIVIGLTLFAMAPHSARAQSADAVLCDRVAADPADPDKPAEVKGVAAIDKADIPLALKYCKIASASSRRALYELGRAYAANQQPQDAIAAFRKAADKGSTSAMVELGVLLGTGNGVTRDQGEAHKLFERAAEAGNARGVTNLAALSGGTASDPVKARAELARAAEMNSAEAQFQLGLMYADGTGGPKDDVAARGLFDKAAAQNHPGALMWLGVFTESGRGGPKDSSAAKSYYERSAALGNDEAKAALKRLECPYVIKDKTGKPVTNLCF